MSKRTIKQEREKRKNVIRSRNRVRLLLFGCSLLIACAIVVYCSSKSKTNTISSYTPSPVELDAAALGRMTNDELERIDIATRNLICGMDIVKQLDVTIQTMYDRLDEMSLRVKVETERSHHCFLERPNDYENSEAYYQMLMLVTVLQQDYGMLYNPDRVTKAGVIEPNEVFFADPRHVFIHGLLQKQNNGTCASLPALVIAVGRSLGYPLALVSTQNHLFVRWNDPANVFNVEVTSKGMNTYPDDYYRKWPYPFNDQEEKENHFLKPMSAAEETAVFFSLRGFCLMARQRFTEAIQAHECAVKLAPKAIHYQKILQTAKNEMLNRMNEPQAANKRRLPPHPMFQDPNLPAEVNWAMWNQRENARIAQQEEARQMQVNPPWNHHAASNPTFNPIQNTQPHTIIHPQMQNMQQPMGN